jgi:hypothetical protein
MIISSFFLHKYILYLAAEKVEIAQKPITIDLKEKIFVGLLCVVATIFIYEKRNNIKEIKDFFKIKKIKSN